MKRCIGTGIALNVCARILKHVGDAVAREPELDAAFVLAVRGALPADAMRDVLVATLWRAGVHPAVIRLEAEHDLVRDLLLAGSRFGRQVPEATEGEAYFPAGIPASDAVFEITYEAWRYFRAPGPSRPPARLSEARSGRR